MGLSKNRRYPKHMIGEWDRRIRQIGLTWVMVKFLGAQKQVVSKPCADQTKFCIFCVRVLSKYYSLGKNSGKRQNVAYKSYHSLFRFAD